MYIITLEQLTTRAGFNIENFDGVGVIRYHVAVLKAAHLRGQ